MSDPSYGLDWSGPEGEPILREPAEWDRLAAVATREGDRIATTKKLKALIHETHRLELNRQAPENLLDRIDPLGMHIVVPVMEHHFVDGKPGPMHYRCTVLVKLTGEKDPLEVTMDIARGSLRSLPLVHPPRRIASDPEWQQTLGLYGDLLENIRRNPPMLGIAVGVQDHPEEGETYDTVPYPQRLIEGCAPWFVDKEMLHLVESAAASLDEHQFSLGDLVTPTAFVVLETPVWFDHSEFGEVPVRALSWKPWMGEPESGQTYCQAWFDLEHPDFDRRNVDQNYRGRLWPGVYTAWFEGERIDAPLRYDNAGDDMRANLIDLRRFVLALWLLSAQRVALVSGMKPARGLRRQAQRQKLPSTVIVVRLRRPEPQDYDGEPNEVQWSHRWVVSGHWRRLDRDGLIKTVWVSPYVKGPADKPLIVKDRFYKFER